MTLLPCLLLALLTTCSASAQLPPAKVVANLYQQHAKQSPFFQTKNRALLDAYFTKKLADLLWQDALSAQDEVGALEADPLYNAQDRAIKKFLIHPATIQGRQARVAVTFENFSQKQVVVFLLRQESIGWKIDNIQYDDGYSLLRMLQMGH